MMRNFPLDTTMPVFNRNLVDCVAGELKETGFISLCMVPQEEPTQTMQSIVIVNMLKLAINT